MPRLMPQAALSKRSPTRTLMRNTVGPGQTTQTHHENKSYSPIYVHMFRPPCFTTKIPGPLRARKKVMFSGPQPHNHDSFASVHIKMTSSGPCLLDTMQTIPCPLGPTHNQKSFAKVHVQIWPTKEALALPALA